ncbi:hypothetical protein [Kibdelosporangium phytohabitans]|uniref:Uncharacterized protein n=1 Tax=Kibdelosporangium phytohabitans TaxID=860235 RepID=A0A0N9I039_9PSEU|nr:hypothetical protein [Kibdelosporangium phytohabitans]ALG09028.1 hypothetical protein AOZ06_20790 [Kibdelosporangium phytohabitans]MBE1469789.1 hypothetical protein [Kibdelosporangium phytohabitans]
MTDSNPRSRIRHLVGVMRAGDDESLVLEMARLTADRADDGRESHVIVSELISALATMMLTASGTSEEDNVYGLELTGDDDSLLDIDETSPPVRAAVRALLAQLNTHTDEARFQVELALQDTGLKATIEVLAHVLLWTIGMIDWCDEHDVPRPRWLGDLASAHRGGSDGRD